MVNLPVRVLIALAIFSAGTVVVAEQHRWSSGIRDIAGAVVSEAVVGAVLLWHEQTLEKRRDERERERELAEQQRERDEWVALMLQFGPQSDLSEI